DTLAAEHRVAAATLADLGAVATAIAARDGDPSPGVASGEALRATLLAAASIHYPDPSGATAGIHFDRVIRELGIREAIATRVKTAASGAAAMRALAQAPAGSIGCTQATEILATAGVRLVAPLPKGFDLETVYTAAVSAAAPNARESAELVARLAS